MSPFNRPWIAASTVAVLAAVAQWPAVDNYFLFDDFEHLFARANEPLLEFLLKSHGAHAHVVPNIAIALLHALFGANPGPYHLASWFLHLVNSWLVYRICAALSEDRTVAVLLAVLWGTSALHQSVVGWWSAFGIVYAASCALWILFDLTRLSTDNASASALVQLRWYALLLAAGLGLGVGTGIAIGFGAVIWLLLPPTRSRNRVGRVFATTALVLPALYAAQGAIYAAMAGEGRPSVEVAFDLLVESWAMVPALAAALVSYGISALLMPPVIFTASGVPLFGISWPLWPVAARVMCIVITILVVVLLTGAWRRCDAVGRRQLLAFGWLSATSYGLIALGRVSQLALKDWSVEFIAVQPRYHYVGTLAALFALAVASRVLPAGRGRRGSDGPARAAIAVSCLCAVAALNAAGTRLADRGDADRVWFEGELTAIRAGIAAQPGADPIFIENQRPIGMNARAFPGRVGVFTIIYPENRIDGRKVYFVESDINFILRARRRPKTRLAALLVGPARREPPKP